MATEQTRSAISEVKSLAMEAACSAGRPASFTAAACRTICRPASTWVAMSARRKPTAWCSMIGLPMETRSFA